LYKEDADKHDYNIIQCLSELVFKCLENSSFEFDGYAGDNWLFVHEIFRTLYPRFGIDRVGMNPLQQRVGIMIVEGLKENIEQGYFPPITKIALGLMLPYEWPVPGQPKTAYRLLVSVVFQELKHLRRLRESDRNRFGKFIPKTATYLPETDELVHTFSGGQKVYTCLTDINIEEASLLPDRVAW